MAEDQLRPLIDAIRSRLQAELETHLGSLAETHSHAIEEARRSADAAAEQRWAARLEQMRGEWDTQRASEVAAARADVERSLTAELERVRAEAARLASDVTVQARRELDAAVAAERGRAQADLERAYAELERAKADRERTLGDLERAHGELERAQGDLQRAQTELQRAHDDLASRQADRAGTQADLERLVVELQRAQGDLQRTQADLATARADAESVRAAAAAAQADTASAKADVTRIQQDLQRTRDDLQRSQAQYEEARAQAAAAGAHAGRELATSATSDAEHAHRSHARVASSATVATVERSGALLDALHEIDRSTSLSDALAAVVRGAARAAPRVALFIVNGVVLQEWPVDGVPSVGAGQFSADGDEAGFLADVVRTGEIRSLDGTNGSGPPAFAGLAVGGQAIAVPFVLGGHPVAVLYADGSGGRPTESWRETVEILGRHASAFLGYLTVLRTAEALKLIAAESGNGDGHAIDDDQHGARRYARLLMSEIKMYNDGAVRAGRERRDLLQRLKPEIDRARQMYEARIAPSQGRDFYFQQELVQTLADGDSSLLG
jgi:hypothetical protein